MVIVLWGPGGGGGGTVVHAGGGCQFLLAVVRFTPLPPSAICVICWREW